MNKLLPLAFVASLGACVTVPETLRPAPPVAATWPAKLGAGEAAPKTEWRAIYGDPALQTLIAAALEHNRDLRVATARLAEARAQAGLASAERWPSLDLAVQRSAVLTPASLSATGRQGIAQRYDVNLGISAFELDFWGRVQQLEAAARANYLASDFAREAFRLALIADVASTYFAAVELEERLMLAESTLTSRTETRRLVRARRDVGLATALDAAVADAAVEAARGERAALARQLAAADNALVLLVGSTAPLPARVATLAAVKLGAEAQAGVPAEVLLQRPDVRAAEQKLLVTQANLEAARTAFFPRIVLTASAGLASRALSGLFAAGSGAWAFAPAARLPLFDAGRTQAGEEIALARREQALAEYDKTIQQAFREVADLLTARGELASQGSAQEALLSALRERARLVEARLRAGVATALELLEAQREVSAAEQGLVSLRRQQLAVSVALYKGLALY